MGVAEVGTKIVYTQVYKGIEGLSCAGGGTGVWVV